MRNSNRVRTAALTLAATVLSLLAAELVLAVVLPESNLRTTAGLNIFVSDDELGYRLQSNVYRRFSWLDREIVIRTDSSGHRVAENHQIRESSASKLLVAGDSYVFGNEVMAEETFTHLLGRALDVQPVNLGVGGYSISQSARALSHELARSRSDSIEHALLVFFIGNDLEWGASPRPPIVDLNGYLIDTPADAQRRVDQLRLWVSLNSRLAFYGGKVFAALQGQREASPPDDTTAQPAPPVRRTRTRWIYDEMQYTAERLAGHRAVFGTLRDQARRKGVALTVVLLPERGQVEEDLGDLPTRQMTALLTELGVRVIDPLPGMRAAYLRNRAALYHSAQFGHLSPEGHRQLAARLAIELSSSSTAAKLRGLHEVDAGFITDR